MKTTLFGALSIVSGAIAGICISTLSISKQATLMPAAAQTAQVAGFNADIYLMAYPDVAKQIQAGKFKSALDQIEVLKLLNPHLRTGGMLVSDNVGTFKDDLRPYVEFLQKPENGYRSSTLALKGGTELSIKVR
ncbi:MAG: hypothetical protein KME45_00165 [Stenomitos rutilans HA7619-LM2]|jgi:hypothetical protein|nr:hypothetical protein [Stenomitos rutilans HA7619-LM2]